MLFFGLSLMVIGWLMGLIAIYKASHYSMSAVCAGWLCYGGIFVSLLGAVLVGKVL